MTRGPDVLPRTRVAPVRDGLRPSRAVPKSVQRVKYRARLLQEGRCVYCYHKRGPRGTRTMCRMCAAKHDDHAMARTALRLEAGVCVDCGKPKGEDRPTRYRCRPCADRHNARANASRARRRESAS